MADLDRMLDWARKDDEDLRLAIRRLAWLTINEAYQMLESGRPQDKLALISRLTTPMLRVLGEDDTGGREIEEMRADLDRVWAEVRGEPSADAPEADDPR